jgi:predicted nuclease of predicted toxin-antitoxin system
MGTLASELSPHVDRAAITPRVYVDANVPVRLVEAMRRRLRWDVWYVMEHDDLRRATDGAHFRLARQLRRTLITLDRDYLDEARFPLNESGGVVVLTAPNDDGFLRILRRMDRQLLRAGEGAGARDALPLERRTLHLHVDWADLPAPSRRRRRGRRFGP